MGRALLRARTPANRRGGEPAPLLDAVEQRLARGDGGKDQRHAVGKRTFDMLDRAWPLDLGERRVNGDELVARNDTRDQDRHRLAVLPTAGRKSPPGRRGRSFPDIRVERECRRRGGGWGRVGGG